MSLLRNPNRRQAAAPPLRRLILLLSLSMSVLSGTSAQAREPISPAPLFAGESRGEAAIAALGNRLAAVAARHGLTAERLRAILRRDQSLRLDARDRLFYVEARPGLLPATADVPAAATAAIDPGQAFLLHSRSGAGRILHLDFDGASVSGTAWNVGRQTTFTAPAFDVDGDPGRYSLDERQRIIETWLRVAEDFAPFDVDVTTEDPGDDAIRRSSADDPFYGTRVIVTREVFPCNCGGIAYVGVFNDPSQHDYYQPAWVFFDQLSNGVPKYMAEAISHETGHNLGLHHDGNASEAYDSGHGGGDTGWAPIMGVGYYRNLSQWSKGEYAGANNFEDDLAVIPQFGAPAVIDDASDSVLLPTPLGGTRVGNAVTLNRSGLIDRAADADIYSFSIDAGPYSISVSPNPVGPNLDIEASLLDSFGNPIAVANPGDRLDASLSGSLAAGTYLLRINGIGMGTPTTGYSDYGSIGHYQIAGSIPRPVALPPLAAFTATPDSGEVPLPVSFDGGLSGDPDGVITEWHWDFGDGSSASGVTATHQYEAIGSYSASLTVRDDDGLTASSSRTIELRAAAAAASSVQSISITASQDAFDRYQCVARVAVVNQRGEAVAKARVSGKWSGSAKRTVGGTSQPDGVATIKGPKVRKQGTCVYTVTGIRAPGLPYDPANNSTASGSLSY